MKLGILGPNEEKSGYTTKRLIEEAKKEFKKVQLIPIIQTKLKIDKNLDVIYGKESLKKYNYILPRIDSKRAAFGYPIISFLDDMGVKKPYVAETVLIAHNKFLTLQKLVKNKVPVPITYLTAGKSAAKDIVDKLKTPMIIKLLAGFGGQGVMFMESKEAAMSVINTMRVLEQEICLEEYIKNPGEDVRGIVAGNEIIASFKRIAAPGEKRANIYAGGRAEAFKLTPEMEEIVFKAAEAIKSKICAVDMIAGDNGIYVIEVNINPGIQGIEKATNLNVAQRMISFVKSELKK